MSTLFIDNRERMLISELEKRGVSFNIKQLDLGDIKFTSQDGADILIIERKTVSDLASSIVDGRSREQKTRMLGSGIDPFRIIYLIEGSLDKNPQDKVNSLSIDTLIGSMINTMLRDKIRVYKTLSLRETAEFIVKLKAKIDNSEVSEFLNSSNGISYSSTLKTRKKDNMTPSLWFICSLSQIPGVSDSIATTISQNYPNMYDLYLAYESCLNNEDRCNLLADIHIQSQKQQRKIGKVISKRVYEFFYGCNQENTKDERKV